MKFPLLLLSGLALTFFLKAQNNQLGIDSALAVKITVSGFCLCQTTVDDLKRIDKGLAEVPVEEMNLGKRCGGSDSRFVNGKGYYSDSFPGMIFQKEEASEFISKIRLTKAFRGKLPNGSVADLSDLRLKDALNKYPNLKNKWGSRDCSDFWSFSNDTIAFYVRVDSTKKPKYPVDEAYYLDRPVDGIDLVISCYGVWNPGSKVFLFSPSEPIYILDNIRINEGFLKTSGITPSDIAFLTVYSGVDAIARAGKEGKNGVIAIVTKSFARQHYWDYFRSKSADYANKVPDLKTEIGVIYVLDDKLIDKDQEMTLYKINDDNFNGLQVVGEDFLKKTYQIQGKSIGVVIQTKPQ